MAPAVDPSRPVEGGSKYWAFDPRTGLPGGRIVTSLHDEGLTVTNTTLPLHLLNDGQIIRIVLMVPGTLQLMEPGIM